MDPGWPIPSHLDRDDPPHLKGVVQDVLPRMGIATIRCGSTDWTVTRSTPGLRFEALSAGVTVALTVDRAGPWLVARDAHIVG